MDGLRFDTLTRALAASDGPTHRRGFLKAVAAGLTAVVLGRATTETAVAVCPPGQVSRRRVGCDLATGTCFQLP